jgi:hypothetical protein
LVDVIQGAPVKTSPGFAGIPPVHGADAYDTDKPKEGKKRRTYVHPLDLMYSKKIISHELWLAGVRFRSDYELAHVIGEQTVNWSRMQMAVQEADRDRDELAWPTRTPKQPMAYRDVTPRYVDKRQELEQLGAKLSPVSFALLVCVCGRGVGIEELSTLVEENRAYLGRRFREALEEVHQWYSARIEAREKA